MNRRRSTVQRARLNPATHLAEPTGDKGPKATTPKHGKRNRRQPGAVD